MTTELGAILCYGFPIKKNWGRNRRSLDSWLGSDTKGFEVNCRLNIMLDRRMGLLPLTPIRAGSSAPRTDEVAALSGIRMVEYGSDELRKFFLAASASIVECDPDDPKPLGVEISAMQLWTSQLEGFCVEFELPYMPPQFWLLCNYP